jgi:hypothetical protein
MIGPIRMQDRISIIQTDISKGLSKDAHLESSLEATRPVHLDRFHDSGKVNTLCYMQIQCGKKLKRYVKVYQMLRKCENMGQKLKK